MRSATAYAERLEHLWIKELFLEFHANLDRRRISGNMASRVPGHFAFLQRIERHCDAPKDLTQTMLLNLFGSENLRRMERITAFLVERLSIPWDARLPHSHSAATITNRILLDAEEEPWSTDLRRFHASLVARDLAARTVKVYLTAAFGLLKHAEVECAEQITQTNVNGWLHRRRGHAASLGCFLSWIADEGGSDLTAHGRPKTSARRRERTVLREAEALMARLRTVEDGPEHDALLARVSALLLGSPLEDILALKPKDVAIADSGVTLSLLGREGGTLPSDLEVDFRRTILGKKDLLFAGRTKFKVRSVGTALYYINKNRNSLDNG